MTLATAEFDYPSRSDDERIVFRRRGNNYCFGLNSRDGQVLVLGIQERNENPPTPRGLRGSNFLLRRTTTIFDDHKGLLPDSRIYLGLL